MDSFVLLVISATYLKGYVSGKASYEFVASLLATVFAFVCLLSSLAKGEISYGVFGFLSLPLLFHSRVRRFY